MAINTTQIARLLRPGLAAIFGDYNMYPSEWSEIYKTYESDKAVEYEQEMKFTGLAQIRAEGSPTAMDTMGARSVYQYVHQYVGLGVTITRQAMMDNLYKTRFPMIANALKNSMNQTKEILGASILNNGFNAAYPLGDGVSLYSQNHPIDGGVIANTPAVSAQLNEAALESALIAISTFKDQAGLIVKTIAQKLIVPPSLTYTAQRLMGSEFRVQTNNNDISAMYSMNSIPLGFRVNHYLTLPTAWFLITDAPNGFKHYIREPLETDVYADFHTDNVLSKALERYSFGASNFRCSYASGN